MAALFYSWSIHYIVNRPPMTGLLDGVFYLLTYRTCLAVFSRVPSHLRPVEVVHDPMKCLGKTCMTKGGIDLV